VPRYEEIASVECLTHFDPGIPFGVVRISQTLVKQVTETISMTVKRWTRKHIDIRDGSNISPFVVKQIVSEPRIEIISKEVNHLLEQQLILASGDTY
jgi:hypothetical protein